MKRSELKEAIKSEIKSVLSGEITEAKFIKFKGDSDDNKMEVKAEREMNTLDGKLKVYTVKTDKGPYGVQSYTADQVELVEDDLKEGTWSSGTYNEIGRFIQDVKNLRDKYYDIVGSDDVFDGLDRAEEAAREMMINAPENRSDVTFDDIREDEEEPTSSELKKKDSVATISNKLQKLTAKMKDKAKEFKAAEGEAKDKIKDELKDMTAEKKELEKSL